MCVCVCVCVFICIMKSYIISVFSIIGIVKDKLAYIGNCLSVNLFQLIQLPFLTSNAQLTSHLALRNRTSIYFCSNKNAQR